jgi:hypothetical protein
MKKLRLGVTAGYGVSVSGSWIWGLIGLPQNDKLTVFSGAGRISGVTGRFVSLQSVSTSK